MTVAGAGRALTGAILMYAAVRAVAVGQAPPGVPSVGGSGKLFSVPPESAVYKLDDALLRMQHDEEGDGGREAESEQQTEHGRECIRPPRRPVPAAGGTFVGARLAPTFTP